ncbi:DJ-1 family glyoxalase III [Endozoicomonadaceae bacterium StTr2]
MPAEVLVPIADGSEEIEAVTVIDTLRRANCNVTVAACTEENRLSIEASRGIRLIADCHISFCASQSFDLIALPGGMPGARHLRDCEPLISLLQKQQQAGRWYAAICAAPAVVLAHHALLDNVCATCYPDYLDQLETALPSPDTPVVVDPKNRVITAQGPASAMSFSFALIDALCGKDMHRPIARQMLAIQ